MLFKSRKLLVALLVVGAGVIIILYGNAVACGGSCGGGGSAHQHDSGYSAPSQNHGKTQDANRPQEPNNPPQQVKAAEQTTCPVMGNAINKELFTTYKGKKVYFCCGGCKPKFKKNPDEYVKKLPQFRETQS